MRASTVVPLVAALCIGGAMAGAARAADPGLNGEIAMSHRIAASSSAPPRVSIDAIDPSTLVVRRVVKSPPNTDSPAWSPDGERIAFARTRGPGRWGRRVAGINVADPVGGHLRRVTRPAANQTDLGPTWSPDGSELAFVRATNLGPGRVTVAIYRVRLDGSRLRRVATGMSPAWSVDGRIAFVRAGPQVRRAYQGIYTLRPDGTGLRRLTRIVGNAPDWSPDGRRLLFIVGGRIHVVGADGTRTRRLRSPLASDAAWSPDGRSIAFAQDLRIGVIDARGGEPRWLTAQARRHSYGKLDWRPRPGPGPSRSSLKVGAYYYGWYSSDGRHWADGYLRHQLIPAQQPLLGQYDSRAASTIAAQLGWAQRYGIDYLISSWPGQGSYEDVTTRDHLLDSPAIRSTKVALMYESLALLPVSSGVIMFDATSEAKLLSDVDYMSRRYFANPHYLRVGGRPVLYLYVTRIWRGGYAHAIATLRSTIKQRYGYDLYLVGDEVDWDGTPTPDRIKLFDAITAYTMYSDLQTPGWPNATGYLAGVRDRYARFKAAADAAGVRFIPGALPGFNDRGVRLASNHYVLPPELHAGADGSFSLFRAFLDVDASFLDPIAPMLDVTSFNEWHEGTEIEPTGPGTATSSPTTYTQGYTYTAHGFRLLEALEQFRTVHGL